MSSRHRVHIFLCVLLVYNSLIVNSTQPMEASSMSPPILSLYKYEGNFYPITATKKSATNQVAGLSIYGRAYQTVIPVQLSHQIFHAESDKSQVSSGATSSGYEQVTDAHPLQQVESGMSRAENFKIHSMSPAKRNPVPSLNGVVPRKIESVTRHYHDIFLKMKSPQEFIFGHVLNWPAMAEKKIEKRIRNHYKGQVIWADKKGGYGEHYWNLAQGAL